MTRYIDADALKFYGNHIGDEYEDRFHDKQWVHRDEIDDAPTIDAVEVVRCKDCKYWNSNTEFCNIWSCLNVAQRTLNRDYCSRGERRDESEEEE